MVKIWTLILAGAMALFATISSDGDGDNDDFTGPQTSGGNDTANVPYSPPEKPPDPIMREREPSDGPEPPEHEPEDMETLLRSEGEGSGQDEESPEPPGD
jgi:hypothetical protein